MEGFEGSGAPRDCEGSNLHEQFGEGAKGEE